MRKCALIVAMLLLFSLTGCVAQGAKTEIAFYGETSVTEAEAPETIVETTSQADGAKSYHFFMAIDENIQIDATVTEPGEQAYSIYTLNMVDCTPERLFGIFSRDEYGSYTTEDRGYSLYEEINGKQLVVYSWADFCKIKY